MIRGSEVYLTCISEDNINQLRLWRNKPGLKCFFREYREISEEMQKEWYRSIQGDDTQIHFEIHIKPRRQFELIGYCGLSSIDWRNRSAEFGIYIADAKHQRKGHGSDALRALCVHGFHELNLHRIWGEAYSHNPISIAVCKYVGFKEEGVLKDTQFCEGRYVDSIMLSMLETDFKDLI